MLKNIFRAVLFNLLAIGLTSKLFSGLSFGNNPIILLYAAAALTIINFLVVPLLKILLLPINIITLGTFRWVVNVLALYLVVIFVPGFSLSGFHFSGLNLQGVIIPSAQLSVFWVYIIASLLIGTINSLLSWLVK